MAREINIDYHSWSGKFKTFSTQKIYNEAKNRTRNDLKKFRKINNCSVFVNMERDYLFKTYREISNYKYGAIIFLVTHFIPIMILK